uniref:PAN2-PAN3 deadenylation complex catalytic subunit PAN2 N-terminal domain-containing protein n=1 Tax=Ditylenchus dipsaci TaxID=166011 RepID=A0A915D224_9BILA
MNYTEPEMEGEEVQCLTDCHLAFLGNSMLTSCTGMVQPISALKFDCYQELLWSANNSGKVGSFYGIGLNDYTCFTAFTDAPVKDLEVVEEAVVPIGKDSICGFKRQGLLLFEYSSPNLEDLTCGCSLPVAPNSLLLGGKQNKIVQLDLITQKEQRVVHLKETDCLDVRANDRYVFTVDSSGVLTMRSLNSMETISSTAAHSGGVSDFDVCDNRVITCGFTNRAGTPYCDPFLKVYDVRNLKALLPHSVLFPPTMCRFANPFSDGQLIVASKYGHVMATNLNTSQNELLYQCCNGMQPVSITVSSTRQCAAIGDNAGSICLFGDRQSASTFNLDSWPTVFPTVDECLPPISIDDSNSSLAFVPTPLPPSNGYCSDFWPENFLRRKFRLFYF